VSAFERLLSGILPNRAAMFVQERQCTYELAWYEQTLFDAILGPDINNYDWPFLVVVFPTGLIDSPLSHVLVAHELGHAIVAVESPSNIYPAVTAQLRVRLKQAGHLRWNELGRPTITEANDGQPRTQDHEAFDRMQIELLAEALQLLSSWVEELFADAVGVCLFGPAYVIAFVEYLIPMIDDLFRPSGDHPAGAIRVNLLLAALRHPDINCFSQLPQATSARLEALEALCEQPAASQGVPLSTRFNMPRSNAEILEALDELTRAAVPSIVDHAVARCKGRIYTGTAYSHDMSTYLDGLVRFGVPPIAEPGQAQVSLATILNVGQAVACDEIAKFAPQLDRAAKEQRLDSLLLKAIELAEFQAVWDGV
jgi:hypothetical protein